MNSFCHIGVSFEAWWVNQVPEEKLVLPPFSSFGLCPVMTSLFNRTVTRIDFLDFSLIPDPLPVNSVLRPNFVASVASRNC